MSICRMSICQYVRIQLFSLGIKMKVVQKVIRMSDSHYVIMSIRQYVSMSVCQYQYDKIQLFSLDIKMKVVQNVIRMSDSHYVNTNTSVCQYANMSEFDFSDQVSK